MLGLGCTLSALITGELALGRSLPEAVRRAHAVVQHSLQRPRMLADGIATPGELRDAIAPQRMDESGA